MTLERDPHTPVSAADLLLQALALPAVACVSHRVPKKMLIENGALTAADKRLISEGIQELVWVAALKPMTIGIPEYRDAEREYLEIAVLTVTYRATAKAGRLTPLIHRAIPYPVVLVAAKEETVTLSLGHKRFSQAGAGKTVLEDLFSTDPLVPAALSSEEQAFLESLALARQPARDLFRLYEGWVGCVMSLAAAQVTGNFIQAESPDEVYALRTALDEHTRLLATMASLRAEARRETQLSRRVELNLEIRRLEAEVQEQIRKCTPAGGDAHCRPLEPSAEEK